MIGGSVLLFRALPTGFIPQEDQGYLFVPYFLPDSASSTAPVTWARGGGIDPQASAVANISQSTATA